jgi:hypothetical protein
MAAPAIAGAATCLYPTADKDAMAR